MLAAMNTTPAPHLLTILTGASRGLGLALGMLLIQRGHRLLTLQRTPNPQLDAAAAQAGTAIEQWAVDLADPLPVAQRLQDWIGALPRPASGAGWALNLVNNAALLVDPAPLSGVDLLQASRATRASLEAPLLLSAAFLGASADWGVTRRVLNISSGLGRHAMAGSAVYCAAKAGMDHFSRAVALEEAEHPAGAAIVSLAPGVVDTDMQVQLRGADPHRFSSQARFATLKSAGQLDSPESAAAKVLALLEAEDFGADPIQDVRTAVRR
jgi:NAD(P)-dependent dehydrogenase (short-subunit alcohol dehydrogenase family)